MNLNEKERPNVTDSPQGTFVQWSDETPRRVAVLVWNSYAPATGKYNGALARFSVNEETKTLTLETVSERTVNNPMWVEGFTVTDRIKRAARKFIAKETSTTHWRVKEQ